MCSEPALRDASQSRLLWVTWQRAGNSNAFAWHVDSHREVQDVCLPWVRQPSSRRSLASHWGAPRLSVVPVHGADWVWPGWELQVASD